MWELIVLFGFVEGVLSLHLVALNVPELTSVGDHIRLSCNYRLEGDQLYSIKWYKDDMEFFRYVPTDRPPGQFFPLPGIKIDLDRSLNGTVFIKDVDYGTAGMYRCEVSADAPSFQTVSAQKPMVVQEYTGKGTRRSTAVWILIVAFWIGGNL